MTELMTLNMGPHHPSTHGVLRLIVECDGEVVTRCTPDLGYLHRSIEKIGEFLEFPQFVPYTCLLYTSPSPRDRTRSRMPSSA